jgi:hypothetical protein
LKRKKEDSSDEIEVDGDSSDDDDSDDSGDDDSDSEESDSDGNDDLDGSDLEGVEDSSESEQPVVRIEDDEGSDILDLDEHTKAVNIKQKKVHAFFFFSFFLTCISC